MRARPDPVEALAALTRWKTRRSDGRAGARPSRRSAPAGAALPRPPPLDGIDQEVIARAAELALDTGLADDLDWLATGAAAVALYEITAALPPGKARRELGRRVFARLYEGTASTFATVAARMALTSGRPFDAAALRARIGLVFDLPIGGRSTPTAWRSRSSLAASFASAGSTRTQRHPARAQARRQAHRARRARGGACARNRATPPAASSWQSEPVAPHTRRCSPIASRSSGVTSLSRAACSPPSNRALQEEIELSLDEALTPTEWRRAARVSWSRMHRRSDRSGPRLPAAAVRADRQARPRHRRHAGAGAAAGDRSRAGRRRGAPRRGSPPRAARTWPRPSRRCSAI